MRSFKPLMFGALAALIVATDLSTAALALPIPAAVPAAAQADNAVVPVQYERRYRRYGHRYYGERRSPRYGGWQRNMIGRGVFTRGPDGGFGGYPPGSAGAQELQTMQRYRCRNTPRSC